MGDHCTRKFKWKNIQNIFVIDFIKITCTGKMRACI